ncbi:hypothetical protein RSAG8_13235, partial [Rhizoctonia solani AG-8 WAC10335]
MARNTSIRQNQHSQTVPWGNQEDPSNRDESQGRRFGRWQAQLKQASELFEAEEEIGSLKQQLQERDTEIRRLQASRNGDAAHASAQPDGNRSTPTAELVAALSTYSTAEGIARGNGAKQLLKDDAYMWAPDNFEDQKELFERFFRSERLIRATKLFLLGPSSLEADKRAASAASGGLRLLGGFKGAS